jgi:pyruvate dehydrogenase E1 component alpha subunit
MAALWRLPLLVAVEHNGIAQSTPTAAQLAGTIAGRAAAFGVEYLHVVADDVVAMRERLATPLAKVRTGHGPLVVEFATRRLGPHSKGDDLRAPDELAGLRAADWYTRCAGPDFERIDREQLARVAAVVRDVTVRQPALEEQWPVDA